MAYSKKIKRPGKRGKSFTRVQKIAFFSIVLMLPLVLVALQQRQDIRQRAAAVDPATGTAQPLGQTSNWQLIFSDEFNGTSLDSTKWIPCYPYWDGQGCNHGDRELQWYQPQNISFTNGVMNLIGKKETKQGGGKTYNYTAGMVSSAGKFSETYYYMEMRAKSPKGQGYWPAFWTLPDDNSWPPEIDVMEILGHQPNVAHTTYHWNEGGNKEEGKANTGADFSADYHVYAADWRADAIVWYIDGVEVYRYTDASKITNKPMYMLVNLAIGGEWPGDPDASTTFPQSFDIDYVRAWKPGTGTNPSTVVPSGAPAAAPSMPTYCLGPCAPSQQPALSMVPSQAVVYPSTAQPSTSVIEPSIDPCEETASVAHDKRHKNKGNDGGLIESLLNFFMQLITMLLQLLGGGQTQPIDPSPIDPSPIDPSPSTPEPSGVPC